MPQQTRFLELANKTRNQIRELTVEQVRQKIHDGDQFLLIDIREPAEWLKGHIAGAIHLSRGMLEVTIEGIADASTPIVLYCGGGYRSVLAADSLQRMGYSQVSCLVGGYQAWTKKPQQQGLNQLVKAAAAGVRYQPAEAVADRIKSPSPPVLIDVREVSEWRKSTIPNCLNLPRGILESVIEAKVPDETSDIVVFCAAGNRSTLAAESLGKMGYSNVSVMQGGFQAWRKGGFEILKPAPA